MIKKLFSLLFLMTGFCHIDLSAQVKPKEPGAPTEPVRLIRGPYLQSASSTAIIVRWRTDVSERTKVRYGTVADKLDQSVEDLKIQSEHQIRITGLQPATKYYYAIGGLRDTLQIGSANYFVTLPVPETPGDYKIAVLGDCGDNSINQRQVKNQLLKYMGANDLTAWILLGDNAYQNGTDSEFQSKFFNIYKDDLLKKYAVFPTPGNHDYSDNDPLARKAQDTHEIAYFQNFSMPAEGESGGVASHTQAYYSFDIGNIHFLSLDSYGREEMKYRLYDTISPQVQWIKKDLAANKNKDFVIAFFHHPPYTMGSHNSDTEEELVKIRENLIGILERGGVDLVLNGHSHVYERSKLMFGNYGKEETFDPGKHNMSSSSGRNDGSKDSAPYRRTLKNPKGTVYVVTGSAGKLGGKQAAFPHNAMYFSDADHGGSCLLEVKGKQLDLKWICADGTIRDQFTILKDSGKKK